MWYVFFLFRLYHVELLSSIFPFFYASYFVTPTICYSSMVFLCASCLVVPSWAPPRHYIHVSSLYMSEPSQSGLSNFVSKLWCPSDVSIPSPVLPHLSKRESQHLELGRSHLSPFFMFFFFGCFYTICPSWHNPYHLSFRNTQICDPQRQDWPPEFKIKY